MNCHILAGDNAVRAYFAKAMNRCWKIYNKYYTNGTYKSHNVRYCKIIMQYLSPGMSLLDAGCGSEMEFTREFHAKVRMAVGLDIEQVRAVANGPYGIRGDLNYLPFKDYSFDIIISKSVLEHLPNPEKVFHEFARVLKKNGGIVVLTPNRYDYISLIALITPFCFHQWILSRLLNRNGEDTFPTYYRANTRKRILQLFNNSSLTPSDVRLFNQYPAYLMFSPMLFRFGILYERITSCLKIFEQLRGWILASAKRSK